MRREAKAIWHGSLVEGKGELETESKILRNIPYSFYSRFEQASGTNPEELIAAAHAGCFSMALANELSKSNLIPKTIETTATLYFNFVDQSWSIVEVRLNLRAHVPGAYRATFLAAAHRAKQNCAVSRVLNAKIGLDAELEGELDTEVVPEIVIYTSSWCQVCGSTKALLEEKQIAFREIDLDQEPENVAEEIKKRTGLMKVPQVFIGEQFIGNYDDLLRLDHQHKLDLLLEKNLRHKNRKIPA